MGKGQRARETRAQIKTENPQKKVKKNQQKSKAWLTPVIIIAAVIIIAGVLVLNYISENGILERRKIVMESDNFEVTGTMFRYGTAMTHQNFVNSYGDYLSYFGLDTSKRLSAQEYGDGTWFDYFKDGAKEVFSESLVYAEAAKEAGIELDEDDLNNIEASIENMKLYASAYGYTEKAYMATMFGKGVNKDDIRDYYKLITLANKYQAQLTDEKKSAMTDDDVEAYYKANLNTYSTVDVLSYSQNIAIPGDASEDEVEETKKNFIVSMKDLLTAMSPDEFKAGVPAEEVLADGTPVGTLGEVEEKTLTYSEISNTDAADWLFEAANDEYVRAAGDVKEFEEFTEGTTDEEGITSDSIYSVTIYYVTNAPHPDRSATKNVGHILFTGTDYGTNEEAYAKAQEILDEYLAGDKTKESFEALGKEYTSDSNVFYDNVAEGAMVAEFNDWLFDPARKEGDTDIVETDYGFHVMYFVGEGQEVWYANCLEAAVGETISNLYEEMTGKYELKTNDSAIKSVRE